MRIRNDYTNSAAILDDEVDFLAAMGDALAHPARVRIMRYIMEKNKVRESVCNKDLVEAFGYAQATVSQHTKTMIRAGLLETQKQEKRTYYFVNLGKLGEYVNLLRHL